MKPKRVSSFQELFIQRLGAVFVSGFILTSSLCLADGGGGCSGCGGGDPKTAIKHIAIDAFKTLLELDQAKELQMSTPQCAHPDIALLRDSFTRAVDEKDIRIEHSKNDQECRFQDDSGDCPEFMTIRKEKQIVVDIDRLIRHMAHSDSTESEKYFRLQERIIHESYWLAKGQKDWLSQCSRELADHLRRRAFIDREATALLNSVVKTKQAQNADRCSLAVESSSPAAGAPEKLAADCHEINQATDQTPTHYMLQGEETDRISQLIPNRYLKEAPGILLGQGPLGLTCVSEKTGSSPKRSEVCYIANVAQKYAEIRDQLNVAELTRLAPAFPLDGDEKPEAIPSRPIYMICVKATRPHHSCAVLRMEAIPAGKQLK